MSDLNLLGVTNFRNTKKRFGIKTDDRRRHMYVLGKTGMGKSTVLENMIIQDILAGRGCGVIDPHGDLVEKVIRYVPSHRINDVVYFNPADMENPLAFNVLERVEASKRHLVASGLIGVFKKIWADSWGPRLEYLLRNAILALLDYPESTLLGVVRMLSDKEYRKKVVAKIEDPMVKAFWTQEFAKYTDKFATEAVSPIQNKVGQFLSVSLIRNIVGQVKSSFNMRKLMDEKKIVLMNLSKGRVGEDNSAMLGAMLITKISLAAMSRVDIDEDERNDFFLYVDEFQNFATESFADILSEARKYRLCLIMAHQYIAQLDEKVRDAVFGNVGTMLSMRVGAGDAEFLEKEFEPVFMQQDLVNLPKWNFYIKLMIDGVASDPFSAGGLPPMSPRFISDHLDKIIKVSRERYGKPKALVEDKIARWSFNEAVEERDESTANTAKCSSCTKETKVFFEPDGIRPIYCKDCLKLLREGKIKPVPPKKVPPNNAPPEPSFIKDSSSGNSSEVKNDGNLKEGINEISQGNKTFSPSLKKEEEPVPIARTANFKKEHVPKDQKVSPESLRDAPQRKVNSLSQNKPNINRKEVSLNQALRPDIKVKEKIESKPVVPKIVKEEPVVLENSSEEVSLGALFSKSKSSSSLKNKPEARRKKENVKENRTRNNGNFKRREPVPSKEISLKNIPRRDKETVPRQKTITDEKEPKKSTEETNNKNDEDIKTSLQKKGVINPGEVVKF